MNKLCMTRTIAVADTGRTPDNHSKCNRPLDFYVVKSLPIVNKPSGHEAYYK